jgi:SAM-dependent methyltransferase
MFSPDYSQSANEFMPADIPPDTSCHLCGSAEHETLFFAGDRLGLTDQQFEVRRCRACGLAFTWPPTGEAELAAFYPNDYWGERTEPDHRWIVRTQREKTRVVSRHAPQGGRILDVGCGAGFFLRALPAPPWESWGVEISPISAEAAERHLGQGRVFAGRLAHAPFGGASFDVVTFWASLEHVVAPRTDLLAARRLLKPSGVLVVQVPNLGSLQARHFGSDWFALDLPRHRFHFSRETLERLLRETGFELVETVLRSETHDAHALKQSLKSRLVHRRAPLGRLRYYLAAPFVKLADRALGGATLTVTARMQ